MTPELRPIAAETAVPLRAAVLRPGVAVGLSRYPGDAGGFHLGAFVEGRLVGCGTLLREPLADDPGRPAWRIRGMAVVEAVRGRGLGGHVLDGLVQHALRSGVGELVWLNGRLPAESFYRRHGFLAVGEVFELAHTGAHRVMIRALS